MGDRLIQIEHIKSQFWHTTRLQHRMVCGRKDRVDMYIRKAAG